VPTIFLKMVGVFQDSKSKGGYLYTSSWKLEMEKSLRISDTDIGPASLYTLVSSDFTVQRRGRMKESKSNEVWS